jgi:hypothetical protein
MTDSLNTLMLRCLTQLVMAALEAAIQSVRATVLWRRVWMAGSEPGHDERGELRARLRVRIVGLL